MDSIAMTRERLRTAALLLGAAGLGGACACGDEGPVAVAGVVPAGVGRALPTGEFAAMAGTWSGTARVSVPWSRAALIPVTLAIAPDGVVGGQVGDAMLLGARLTRNRGTLMRQLGWFTDWIITADLAGDLVAAEGIRRERAKIPFDVGPEGLRGALHSSGTVFGGKDTMRFVAVFEDLRRSTP